MIRKKYLFTLIAVLVVMGIFHDQAKASDSSSETTVTGHVSPSLIKVSAPAKIIFYIDPNAGEGEQFLSSQIKIINNSNAPVKVKINKGTQNFVQTVDSQWKPQDVLPDAFEWGSLGTEESEKHLALGIQAGGEGWRRNTRNSALYVKEQNNSPANIVFGEIDSHSGAELGLVCSHGLSFSKKMECTYTIIWSFSLGD